MLGPSGAVRCRQPRNADRLVEGQRAVWRGQRGDGEAQAQVTRVQTANDVGGCEAQAGASRQAASASSGGSGGGRRRGRRGARVSG